uniref:Cytoplasmic polyadenylation element-binding protein 1 n=1 Tax=Globodera rostochiensis TaxID=31243 RepID=A0A914GT73_GLORO
MTSFPFFLKNFAVNSSSDGGGGSGSSNSHLLHHPHRLFNLSSANNGSITSSNVFVGGLPLDITEETEEELLRAFRQFGELQVQWPTKRVNQGKKTLDGKPAGPGYAFIVFADARSVGLLLSKCRREVTIPGEMTRRYFFSFSSQTVHNKAVQIRPWRHSDAIHTLRPELSVNARWIVFIGGLPRPTRAVDLFQVLVSLIGGGILHVGIDVDSELCYPKGAARICFDRYASFVKAMAKQFVNIPDGDGGVKRVELKPYTLADQPCDQCEGKMCGGQNAVYYCGNVSCLQYYCEPCWRQMHLSRDLYPNSQRYLHKPFVRMGESDKAPPSLLKDTNLTVFAQYK